jgi:type IV secretory pathway TrbD component
MANNLIQDAIAGFEAPVHRALTEPILLAGVPRSVAIINGTLAAAIGLGLRRGVGALVRWTYGRGLGGQARSVLRRSGAPARSLSDALWRLTEQFEWRSPREA